MLQSLELLPPDPILGLMAKFRSDPRPDKVDLGVGIYRDRDGVTPMMAAIAKANRELAETERSKVYVGPMGNLAFNAAVLELALGPGRPCERLAAIQAPGGCGALRVLAELAVRARPGTAVWLGEPTWDNHRPLLGRAGLQLRSYPHFDPTTGGLAWDAMRAALETVPEGDLVLVHASCHNPTGVDLSEEQWREFAAIAQARGFVPLVDMAYQGLGRGIEQDRFGLELLASSLPEVLFAVSCSKNFGVYKERVGLAGAVCETPAAATKVNSHFAAITRGLYSMPPDHGAALVAAVLQRPELTAEWRAELDGMRARLSGLRAALVTELTQLTGDRFRHLAAQLGMFSYLGLSPESAGQLADQAGIYMLPNSRINVAGLADANIGRVARAIAGAV